MSIGTFTSTGPRFTTGRGTAADIAQVAAATGSGMAEAIAQMPEAIAAGATVAATEVAEEGIGAAATEAAAATADRPYRDRSGAAGVPDRCAASGCHIRTAASS
jgi:hypothetical protein